MGVRIDVDAVIDSDGTYRMVGTSPHRLGETSAHTSQVGRAHEAARDRWGHTGVIRIGRFRLARPDVGPDGQFVQTADGEIGTASWLGPEGSWSVTTRTGAGMCPTETLRFGYEPAPAEQAQLDAGLTKRRRDADERWARAGRAVLEKEGAGFAARIADVAAENPGRPLRVGLQPQVADPVDPQWLERLSPDGVTLSVFAVPDFRSWDITVMPA